LIHPKILAWRPYARPLAGFKGATSRVGEEGRKGEKRKGRRGAGRRKGDGRKVGTGPPIGQAGPAAVREKCQKTSGFF